MARVDESNFGIDLGALYSLLHSQAKYFGRASIQGQGIPQDTTSPCYEVEQTHQRQRQTPRQRSPATENQ